MGRPEEAAVRGQKQPPGSRLVPAARLLWRFPRASPRPAAEALRAGPQLEGGDHAEVPRLGWLGTRRAGGPAGARPLAAAKKGPWAEAGLAASPGPRGCPGHGAVTEAPLTQSSGPAQLLPPWGGRRCLLEQGCRVAAAETALDATGAAAERAQEQQEPSAGTGSTRHPHQPGRQTGPYCGHSCTWLGKRLQQNWPPWLPLALPASQRRSAASAAACAPD